MNELRLIDCHAHTSDLSYCCDPGITPQTYLELLADRPDLEAVAITNHGFAAYSVNREEAFAAAYMVNPALFDDKREFGNARIETHLREMEPLRGRGLLTGLEVEMLPDGRLTVDDRFRPRLDVLIGSVHFLPEASAPERVLEVWWAHTERLLGTGIDILGHPFRWLHRNAGVIIDDRMVRHLVELAKKHGVALEINSHMLIPSDLEMAKTCAATGVPLAFGSDAHCLEEMGILDYHRHLLTVSGLDLATLPLWKPRPRG